MMVTWIGDIWLRRCLRFWMEKWWTTKPNADNDLYYLILIYVPELYIIFPEEKSISPTLATRQKESIFYQHTKLSNTVLYSSSEQWEQEKPIWGSYHKWAQLTSVFTTKFSASLVICRFIFKIIFIPRLACLVAGLFGTTAIYMGASLGVFSKILHYIQLMFSGAALFSLPLPSPKSILWPMKRQCWGLT